MLKGSDGRDKASINDDFSKTLLYAPRNDFSICNAEKVITRGRIEEVLFLNEMDERFEPTREDDCREHFIESEFLST